MHTGRLYSHSSWISYPGTSSTDAYVGTMAITGHGTSSVAISFCAWPLRNSPVGKAYGTSDLLAGDAAQAVSCRPSIPGFQEHPGRCQREPGLAHLRLRGLIGARKLYPDRSPTRRDRVCLRLDRCFRGPDSVRQSRHQAPHVDWISAAPLRITEGKTHDVGLLDELILEPGAFYIMDRGSSSAAVYLHAAGRVLCHPLWIILGVCRARSLRRTRPSYCTDPGRLPRCPAQLRRPNSISSDHCTNARGIKQHLHAFFGT